ncbi:MAG: amino acid permease, partial [Paenibacillus macerans]|nr:amino acid permease [Paenibacillus macerans]
TRMLHSMAAGGEAPALLARISAQGVPVNSLKLCGSVLILGSLVAYLNQAGLFRLLMAVPGFVVVLVWITICLSQLKLRKSYPGTPGFKVWGYPYITILTIICLSVIALMFLFDAQNRISISVCLAVLTLLIVWSAVRFRSGAGRGR